MRPPNVAVLEFDEEVYVRSEGIVVYAENVDAFSSSNLNIDLEGLQSKTTFSVRVLDADKITPGNGFKRLEIYLFDFKTSLKGDDTEVLFEVMRVFSWQ